MMTIVASPPTPIELFNSRAFRVLLDCLARPGKIGQLPPPPYSDLPPLPDGRPPNTTAVAACMSLLDQRVSFVHAHDNRWLTDDQPLSRWITLRSGSRVVAPAIADFALLHDTSSLSRLSELQEGSLIYPEQSCTAFLCVSDLVATGSTFRLTGPGIAGIATVGITSHTPIQIELLLARRDRFPLGIDLFLIDDNGRCLGIPRTTRILIPTS
ncbi:MAG TPA: phosphonate C-P lyase system protein PhnH [Chloroflexus aurantiacus]|uniref:Phosphonate C-P lyase system protein PhnH n=1 Tax=Chloroflexus aurantiacus (strain ATCC 29366 / DSM 635 / J-10-fl) TaxID=324602 RepID=A9WG30_CHLAA|nr:phosphonate C-P lyase system protein PhnH [Chloroflexus aurantiacus]ABY36184.1 phosphonate C-P lyase system protein PhnH [Chloroflexus aurantiacus J-10-fl]HBW66410.1 phosphonate C-P lyase system protein PhnH [Chloroflexus aurantiacus]